MGVSVEISCFHRAGSETDPRHRSHADARARASALACERARKVRELGLREAGGDGVTGAGVGLGVEKGWWGGIPGCPGRDEARAMTDGG